LLIIRKSSVQAATVFYHAASILKLYVKVKVKVNSPVTGLEWPREFQEVKVPRFHDNGTKWW